MVGGGDRAYGRSGNCSAVGEGSEELGETSPRPVPAPLPRPGAHPAGDAGVNRAGNTKAMAVTVQQSAVAGGTSVVAQPRLCYSCAMAQPRRLFVLGDSISIQYGPHLRQFIRHWCDYDRKRDPGQSVEDLGQPVGGNGGDSSVVLAYLREQQEAAARFDTLLVNCGLHDIKTDPTTGEKQVPIEEYRRNLEAICGLAHEMSATVVWVETTPVDDERHNRLSSSFHRHNADVLRYGKVAREILSRFSIPVVELYAFTRSLPGDPYCDHVHFTDEVRALQGAHIAGFLTAVAAGAGATKP